jgi:tetratricopeptide (TPR) repeat protein
MRRLPKWVVCILLVPLLAAATARAAASAACGSATESPELTIAHCTAALEQPQVTAESRAAILARRGLAWFNKHDLERAAADYDEAIRSDESSFPAYNSRAILRMQQGDVDRALADYDTAIRLKPDYASALANRGNAWLVKGDADRAIADLDRAIALAPARLELALAGRGRAWLSKADLARAEQDFEAALKSNPKYSNALSGRGYVRFCRGDFLGAAADFSAEHRLRPDQESAVAWILSLRRAGRDTQDELAGIVREGDAATGTPAAVALLAGRLSPAQVLQASTDRDPSVQRARSCAAQFEVGEWYLLARDTEQARQHLALARTDCDRSQPEFAAAGAEIARLERR